MTWSEIEVRAIAAKRKALEPLEESGSRRLIGSLTARGNC
jgi:hypothetical protein